MTHVVIPSEMASTSSSRLTRLHAELRHVRVEPAAASEEGVAVVTLLDAKTLNALHTALVGELVAVLQGLSEDRAVRCVVLRGGVA